MRDPGSAFPSFRRNDVGRDFAVGDIHGCFGHLRRSLEAIGFDVSRDRLFSVGDLVDRGPESDQVLAWLAEPWFHAVCGNHDFMAWRSALGGAYPEVNHLQHGGQWLGRLPRQEQRRIGEALAALPLGMEVETALGTVGLVHAGCPFEDWREMQATPWASIDPEDEVGSWCLWSVERYLNADATPVRNVRAVIHGHMVLHWPEVLGNVHFIDTGGWRPNGYFTFLDLETLNPVFGPRPLAAKAT